MQRKTPAMLVLAILILCPLVPAAAEQGRTPNENGDTFVTISTFAFSTTPLHIGDQNVTLSVTIRNLRQSDGNLSNGDERLYNVSVELKGVENAAGQLMQPAASPLVWDVQSVDNDENGYTLGYAGELNSSRAFTGLQFDVKGIGARPGSYNVSLYIHYSVMRTWNPPQEPEMSAPLTEDYGNIRFEVASNVVVGTPVPYTDAMTVMPLYAGAGFQLIGIPVMTLSGPLTKVVGTLYVPPESSLQPVISPGTSPDATVERITATSMLYFRIELPLANPGVYDRSNANITLILHYIRENNWNGQAANIAAGEDGQLLAFTVDYTPLLNATAASPVQLTRGTELGSVSVNLRNEGNADLVRMKVTMEADADFSPADYHYDGNGNRIPGPARCTIDSLKKGENITAVFHLAVYPNAPPGIHRLELGYTGYFHNTGKTGDSSGYYPFTDALFQELRGRLPYIDIEVISTGAALELVSTPSPSVPLNPGGESEGLSIWLRVRNDEHFGFLNARFTVLAGDGTPVRNPSDRSARNLESVNMPSLGAGAEATIDLRASLNTSLQPGLHQLTLRFNGMSEDSGSELSFERAFFVRTGPFGPDLQIDSGTIAQIGAKTSGIKVSVTVRNSGGAALGGVHVRLACGSGTPIVDPASPGATSIINDIGAMGAGSTARVDFIVDLDSAAEARTYMLGLEVTGSYLGTGELFTMADNISFNVMSAPPLLVVLNSSAATSDLIPGKGFTLAFTVKNIGGDKARGVWVGLLGLAGAAAPFNASQTAGPTGLPGEVPFSADIAVKFLGDIAPGQEVNVSFSMQSDASAGRGRAYQQPVQLWYQDRDTNTQSQQFPLAVRTKAAPAPSSPPKDWTPMILLLVLIIVVIAVGAAIMAPRRAGKARPEPELEARSMPPSGAEPSTGEAPSQVATAVPMQQPPPPPPGYGAVAYSQPLPPPPPDRTEGGIPTAPVYAAPAQPPPPPPPPTSTAGAKATATRVDGGGAQGRAGPLEGYAIPGAEADQPRYSAPPQKPKAYSGKEVPMRTCPTCGNEVKVRFVKCPYCGSDLPPVA
jgi:hypothetical protein